MPWPSTLRSVLAQTTRLGLAYSFSVRVTKPITFTAPSELAEKKQEYTKTCLFKIAIITTIFYALEDTHSAP